MRTSTTTPLSIRSGITVVLAFFMLLTPFSALAQDATPPTTGDVAVPAAPAPGSLQISLTDTAGFALSGSFAVVDANGAYQDVWVTEGFSQANGLTAGTATVTQLTGTTDHAVDATPRYIEVPEGGIGYATITNAFLDADGDGVGDSVDVCPAGNDAVDTDADGTADACDTTPNGDPTPSPTTEPTATATVEPTASPTATTTSTITPVSTPVAGKMSRANAASSAAAASISPTSVTAVEIQTFTVRVANQGGSRIGSARVVLPQGFSQATAVRVSGSGFVGGNNGWLANVTWNQIDVTAQNTNGELNPGGYVDVTFTTTVTPTAGRYQFTTTAWGDRDWENSPIAVASQPAIDVIARVTDCARVSNTNRVPVGAYVMYRCSTNASEIRINLWSLTETWRWAYIFSDSSSLQPSDVAFDSLSWLPGSGQQIDSRGLQHVYIFVTPTSSAAIGNWYGHPAINFQLSNPETPHDAWLISQHQQFFRTIGPGDFSHTCSPAEVSLNGQASATVTCQVSAILLRSDQQATITVVAPVAPAGWTITPIGSMTGTVGNGASLSVTFTITPSSHTPGITHTVQVPSSIVVADESMAGPTGSFTIKGGAAQTSMTDVTATESVWGGTTDLSAKVSPTGIDGSVAFYVNGSATSASGTVIYNPATGTATLTGYAHGLPASTTPYSVRAVFTPSGSHAGSEATNPSALRVNHAPLALTDVASEMSWTRPYSHFDATDSGWIQYTVRGTAAKGWTVQVTASEFSHSGGGPSIPAANLTFSIANTTPGAELTTPATSGSLGTGPIVLSGTSQTPPGPYTQRLNLTMTIPGGTLVGEYTSNITITAAAAP